VGMKTIGLMIAMTQCGLHVPALSARLPVVNAIFADIGDEQSIEQSLSTFSGHITNLVSFLDKVDDHALVILDELGNGTDPIEGAALARSILEYLLSQKALCIVATHYAELKSWAALTEGVANANVAFDVRTLRPLYTLSIGLPGRSNAFAIAQRIGMPQHILDSAQGYTAGDQLRSEDMLARIAQLQRQTEAARDAARRAERAAEKNADSLRARLRDIEGERLKVLEQAREDAFKEMETLRTELRTLRSKVLAFGGDMAAFKKLEAETRETEAKVTAAEEAAAQPPREAPAAAKRSPVQAPRKLRLNDTVRVRTIGAEGTLASVDGDVAEVLIGRMRTRVKLADLERVKTAEAPIEDNTSKYERGYREESPGLELDLRGMMTEEGVAQVTDYLDRAARAGLPFARIIHGRGTGALRIAVRGAIKGNPNVVSFAFGDEREGGDGVTVVKLRDTT
jgi:DNA mismatch repair protein MutS2